MKEKLLEILVDHADNAFDTRKEAEKSALHRSRCGSPFIYRVVEAEPDLFLVVKDFDEHFFIRLISLAKSIQEDRCPT